MGESVLAVHPPRPLTTTDIGLLRIFSSPGIVTRLHAAQEMGGSALAVHLPHPLTMTDIGLPRIFQALESLHGFMLLRKWVSLSSLSTRPAP